MRTSEESTTCNGKSITASTYSKIDAESSRPGFRASLILACVAILVTTPIFYFYRNGEKIRKKSKFAARIQKERDEEEAYMNEKKGGGAEARVEQVEP